VGLSFIGAAWRDAAVLALGHAFEQAMAARRPPTYRASVETPEAFAPAPPG
jgi:amidase